jgi:outer membrane protein assembly factor BamB
MASRIGMAAGVAAMALAVAGLAGPPKAGKSDHVMFGGTPARNRVNTVDRDVVEKPNPADAKALKWKADLGSASWIGLPTISGGRVFVGTNNNKPRNPRDTEKNSEGEVEPIDKGILMCFDEATGKFLWQAVHDKLPGGSVRDWPDIGIISTPLVEGDRVYYVSNRCTLVCLDVNGFADGNQGMATEKYKEKTDADFIWELDMIKDLGVFPHNSSISSPMIVGDLVYAVTSNGVDENHKNIPKPDAPSFIAVDKKTGAVVWKSNLPGKNILHGEWSSPAFADVGGVKQAIFPGGDGWLYSFTADKGELVWKFDANPKSAVHEIGGAGDKSDFIGTPVVAEGKLYIGTGQDPEHFTGLAHFYCIDLAKALKNAAKNKERDVSPELVAAVEKDEEGRPKFIGKPNPASALAWKYGGADERPFVPRDFRFGRTMSKACVIDGFVYISEIAGYLHCLEADTGAKFWQYDLKGEIWGSPYYADGKIFQAASDELFVFKASKARVVIDEIDNPQAKQQVDFTRLLKAKRKQVEGEYLIAKVEFDAPIRSTPVVANGVLYVKTERMLYAFKSIR